MISVRLKTPLVQSFKLTSGTAENTRIMHKTGKIISNFIFILVRFTSVPSQPGKIQY